MRLKTTVTFDTARKFAIAWLMSKRFVAVLEIPPVKSAETAVRLQIVKDVRRVK
jgi:hypothetical protein